MSLKDSEILKGMESEIKFMSPKILIPGLAIILAGFAIISSSTLQTSQEQLASIIEVSRSAYTIELDVPNYFSEDFRRPNKIFSGRTIVIEKKSRDSKINLGTKEVELVDRDKVTNVKLSSKKIPVKKQGKNSSERGFFAIEIPPNIPSGLYTVEFSDQQQMVMVPVEIEGFVPAGAPGEVLPNAPVSPSITVKKIGCITCYWELASAINPINENYGYLTGGTFASGYHFAQTIDGWNTRSLTSIDDRVDPRLRNYRADPKLAFTADNKISLTGVVMDSSGDPNKITSGGLYTERQANSNPLQFAQNIIKSVSVPPAPNGVYFDYPKLAIDTNIQSPYRGTVYVVANQILPSINRNTSALFMVNPAGNVVERRIGNEWYFAQSIKIGPRGEIYIAISDLNSSPLTYRLLMSQDGGNTFTENVIAVQNAPCSAARLSTQSNRSMFLYRGPELAVSAGLKSKLYATWAAPKDCVFNDPTFELSRYGRDFDVYVNYISEGVWSIPVRVNNDQSGGDQGFPSITVDSSGVVYVAFVDHREHQDQPVFDVFLAKSFDLGNTFPINLRVNDTSVPARLGGRAFGDYLDMVSVGRTKTYIAYPCVNYAFDTPARPAADFPSDACVSVVNDIEPPTVPQNLNAIPLSPTQVRLSWSSSVDNLNKVAYRVYRNGALIVGTVLTSYTDGLYSPLQPSTAYTYTVTAYDSSPARNQSTVSAQATATTLPLLDSIPLSINPTRTTVNSGKSVTLIFGVPESTVRLRFFLSCPIGLSSKSQSGNEVCNVWQDLPLATRQYTLSFTNNGASVLKAVPNFYAYYANNPNFANSVSGEITVQPFL